MLKALLLAILSVTFLCFCGKSEGNIQIFKEENCENLIDLAKLIEFPFDPKCLQIVLNKKHQVTCMSKIIGSDYVSLHIRSFVYVKHRDISSEVQENCETFLLFAKNINDAKQIFRTDEEDKKQFYPFTKIYFFFSDTLYDSDMTNMASKTLVKNFLIKNALFGYTFENAKEIGSKVVIRNLLIDDIRPPTLSYLPSDLFHPIVDTRFAKENFRISLFNCKPFTFYQEDASDNT